MLGPDPPSIWSGSCHGSTSGSLFSTTRQRTTVALELQRCKLTPMSREAESAFVQAITNEIIRTRDALLGPAPEYAPEDVVHLGGGPAASADEPENEVWLGEFSPASFAAFDRAEALVRRRVGAEAWSRYQNISNRLEQRIARRAANGNNVKRVRVESYRLASDGSWVAEMEGDSSITTGGRQRKRHRKDQPPEAVVQST
jgi:hypothetical protein